MTLPGAHDIILQENDRWLWFSQPHRLVIADRPEDVHPALHHIANAVEKEGDYAAGFLAYEAAAAYGLSVRETNLAPFPLVWFGLYHPPEVYITLPTSTPASSPIAAWRPLLPKAAYLEGVSRIKDAIAGGYTYQANFTFPLQAAFTGHPWPLFQQILPAQQARYAAYLNTGRYAICSFSPELFFQLDGDQLTSRPMKGTAPRGKDPAGDQANRTWLAHSEKNRAENVMIVDMIRNDMGRICVLGSVQVPHLFTVEAYPTLFQMTSTVTGRTDASFPDILAAMFPCASITGAPKVSTMQILADLEPQPRRVYTGSIGYLAPGRRAQFNVAIRTLIIDQATQTAVYPVGSGIVWDSDAEEEYAECLLKARILTHCFD